MFRAIMPGRTSRAIVAGALILSLAGTTFVGSASAAPLTTDRACSAASQARTDAVQALHDGWKASVSDLKTLASDTHGLRKELFTAWHDLKTVLMQAVEDLKDLGITSVCHEDDAAPTASALDPQVKAIVDKAVADMKAVVDAARTAAGAETTTVDATKHTTMSSGAEIETQDEGLNAQAKDENANEDQNDDAKDNATAKSKATSTNLMKVANFARVGKHKSNTDADSHERD